MYELIIKPKAVLMAKEAYEWYEEQKQGLGEEFLSFLTNIFAKLQLNPVFYKKVRKNYRQVSLEKFPYVIVYEIIKNDIVIFAIFHTRRNPRYRFKG